ncbi:MAG: rhomboid family intramembrane serine protease [Planctomycetota bacterium]
MIPVQDSVPSRNPAVAMWFIIGANAVVFFLEAHMPRQVLEEFIAKFALVPARFAEFQVYELSDLGRLLATLVTNTFLHGDWMHFLGNMWTLYIFGDNVEDRMGPLRFTAFYLLSGALASCAHLVTYWGSPVPALGASGAIAAVMGAYFLMFPTARIVLLVPIFFYPVFVSVYAFLYLPIWFFIQFYQGTLAVVARQSTGIAFWAHIGGFLAGFVLLPLFLRPRGERRPLQDDEGVIDLAWWDGG